MPGVHVAWLNACTNSHKVVHFVKTGSHKRMEGLRAKNVVVYKLFGPIFNLKDFL